MTRINLVDPKLLSDPHLTAENHEMIRPLTRVENAIAKGKKPSDYNISPEYILNKGHETFFYDKLEFLHNRYASVVREMESRGFNVDKAIVRRNMQRFIALQDSEWYNDYTPSPEQYYLNMARLSRRSEWESTWNELIRED